MLKLLGQLMSHWISPHGLSGAERRSPRPEDTHVHTSAAPTWTGNVPSNLQALKDLRSWSYLGALVGEVVSGSCWRKRWVQCAPKSRKRRARRWGWVREEDGESTCPPSLTSSSPSSSRGSRGRGTMRPASGESWASPFSLSSCQDLKAGTGSGKTGDKRIKWGITANNHVENKNKNVSLH